MTAPPIIFAPRRKLARAMRSSRLAREDGAADFLIEAMREDIEERLAFLQVSPRTILTDRAGFACGPEGAGWHYVREFGDGSASGPGAEFPERFDAVISVAALDAVNDLPGALIEMRTLLEPGGLVIASFVGGASLPRLRRAMFGAEPDRPAARIHPMIDPRSCPELLSRAGWSHPVVDTFTLTVRYSGMDRLVQDLREQRLGNVLASRAPYLSPEAADRARAAFLAQADADGKVSETFEIVTLTGRRSLAGT
ncbi:methyltransferase domain-containing protein [Tsuneonella sp. HG222]